MLYLFYLCQSNFVRVAGTNLGDLWEKETKQHFPKPVSSNPQPLKKLLWGTRLGITRHVVIPDTI